MESHMIPAGSMLCQKFPYVSLFLSILTSQIRCSMALLWPALFSLAFSFPPVEHYWLYI
ncbi:hypothetical protein BJY00DRAFT_273865, partial [Aspergillus carlsbadensis]